MTVSKIDSPVQSVDKLKYSPVYKIYMTRTKVYTIKQISQDIRELIVITQKS